MPSFNREWIACAAIRRLKRRECHICYWEPWRDIYDIEIGWRHPDILHRFEGEVSKNPLDQGFYTNKGRFVSREEAVIIAKDAGQISKSFNRKQLTSEDVW